MGLKKLDLQGNPYIGVFCATNDEFLVAPPNTSRKVLREMEEVLGVRALQTTIGGSTVIGALLTLNSHGGVVTHFLSAEEERRLMAIKPLPLEHRLNAAGNTVLANDRGAIVHPGYDRAAMAAISDALGVEVVKGTIAGSRIVGSLAVATNRGAICHPHATPEEIALLRDVLKVEVVIATANYGTPQVGACMVANDKGAVVGTPTTPIELGRIEEGLNLI